VPVGAQSGVVAIAAGVFHTVALKNDGSVLAWGNNGAGQTSVPVAAQSGVVAIAAGDRHTVALKSDGSVPLWSYTGLQGGARFRFERSSFI
jgi:alpha-tubulin suppressor-like RCC1 family protein